MAILYTVDAREAQAVSSGGTFGSRMQLHAACNAAFWRLLAGIRYLAPEFDSTRLACFSWNIVE